jgi:hypothetical protein
MRVIIADKNETGAGRTGFQHLFHSAEVRDSGRAALCPVILGTYCLSTRVIWLMSQLVIIFGSGMSEL